MQRAWQKVAAGQRLFRARRTTVVSWRAVAVRRQQFLFQLMDLLTERRLRYVLSLRRIGEATLIRDSDKIPELMNFHRGSDTPLGPAVCIRLADGLGGIRASRVVLGAPAEQLFLTS